MNTAPTKRSTASAPNVWQRSLKKNADETKPPKGQPEQDLLANILAIFLKNH